MTKTSEPKVKFFDGDDFTCVTFQPDLSKFKMEKLDRDTVALLTRRAYDVAGSCRGVKVTLNGKKLPVSLSPASSSPGPAPTPDHVIPAPPDTQGERLPQLRGPVREGQAGRDGRGLEGGERGGERALGGVPHVEREGLPADQLRQQHRHHQGGWGRRGRGLLAAVPTPACVCVFQGGRHIDYVVDQIVAKLIEVVKKKNKAGVTVKPFQVVLPWQHACVRGSFGVWENTDSLPPPRLSR